MSGIYTPDFPEYPPDLFNFTAETVPDYTTTTIQGTKLKVLNYNEELEIVFQGTNVFYASCMDTPFMLLARVMGTLIMWLTPKATIWMIRLRWVLFHYLRKDGLPLDSKQVILVCHVLFLTSNFDFFYTQVAWISYLYLHILTLIYKWNSFLQEYGYGTAIWIDI